MRPPPDTGIIPTSMAAEPHATISATRAQILKDIVSRQAIEAALALHSRGVDRADAALLAAAYHDGAEVDYGFFKGAARDLAGILCGAMKGQPVTLHRTSNMWIQVQGKRARSESYVMAYTEQALPSGAVQRFIGGRYLDTHECRAGQWRLTHRTYVMDWNTNRPSTSAWPDPPVDLKSFVPRGGQGASDPGRTLLATGAAGFKSREDHRMTNNVSTAQIDALIARQACHDLSMAYCRAADRGDEALMASIFHPDATVVSGIKNGSGADFARDITAFVKANLERCFHSVANEWYEIDGDQGVGESYVIAMVSAGGNDIMTGGRYLDAFERRDGLWKIRSRTFVLDWTTTHPTTFEQAGMYAPLTTRGAFGKNDPIYAFWGA